MSDTATTERITSDLDDRVDELATEIAALDLLYHSQSRHLFEMCNTIDKLEFRIEKLEERAPDG